MNQEETPFSAIAKICKELEGTTKRLEKRQIIANFLRRIKREEIAPAVLLIIGEIFPETESKALDVGWSTLQKAFGRGRQATLVQKPLTILEVKRFFGEIASASGKDSMAIKRHLLESMLGQASLEEQDIILKNISGEMRHGVSEGVMLEGIAHASGLDLELTRRAHMLSGDIGKVAFLALSEGKEGLERIGVELFTPVKPMMAQMGEDLAQALREHGGRTALEYKFDGARIQIHKKDEETKIFSRRLTDVTESLPDIVALSKKFQVENAILEGEVIAVDEWGRPRPFKELMRRFRRVHDVEDVRKELPLRLYLFDILYLNGTSLINEPYEKRWNLLSQLFPPELLADRIVVSDAPAGEDFLKSALEKGHEGLMAKELTSHYNPGMRGKKWLKIKPADFLDVVIIAAEWGHGRREGWLSNYHLAVFDEETNSFQMIGKTFKGLTDKEFEEMTERLLEIKISEDRYTVYVLPQIVVEVAYNEIQRSPHYDSGFALRFARITKIREDKGPREADTMERLRFLYTKQFIRKGKPLKQ